MTSQSPAATLLLTRTPAQSARFLAALGRDWPSVISPLSASLPQAWAHAVSPYQGLIFTSQNGVARAPPGDGRVAYCVGEQTAAAANRRGYAALSADGDAGALVAMILGRGDPGPLIHLRGAQARGNIAERLTAAGVPTAEIVVYRQKMLPLNPAARALLAGKGPVVAPLFSPQTVSNLIKQGPIAAPLHLVLISDAAARSLQSWPTPRSVTVAPTPDAAGMRTATLAVLSRLEMALDDG